MFHKTGDYNNKTKISCYRSTHTLHAFPAAPLFWRHPGIQNTILPNKVQSVCRRIETFMIPFCYILNFFERSMNAEQDTCNTERKVLGENSRNLNLKIYDFPSRECMTRLASHTAGCAVCRGSGAVRESRWPSWAVRPNQHSGFRGRKDLSDHASALVSACP